MNRYKENICRICQKVFCCKKCREEHETMIHKIFKNCNICLYGKTFLRKDPPECLIKHIKKQHWPLHCIICKTNFGSFDELLKQHICQVEYKNKNFEKSPYTPIQPEVENKCYIPKGQQNNPNMFCHLATSTPLQRELAEKNHNEEVITPVEFLDINKDKKYYTDCISIKRKVTFCDTPIAETEEKENVLETENGFEHQIMVTPSSGNISDVFYSAKQYLQENSAYNKNTKDDIRSICTTSDHNIELKEKGDMKNAEVRHEDSILWTSAVNTSSTEFLEENKPFININIPTPVIAKLKKKQVNVVMPTAIRKQNMELPSNLPLTHLNISKSEENASTVKQDSFESPEFIKKVDCSNTNNTNGILAETSLKAPDRLWTSMSKLIKNVANVVQELSSTTYKTPLKRTILEDDLLYEPCAKRYKLTDIKCRRPIRQLTVEYLGESTNFKDNCNSNSIIGEIKKRFVDKSTQTDEKFP